MDVAAFEAAGLYDAQAPNAPERLALLRWLIERGATIEQMVDAARHRSLTGLAGDLALHPGRAVTLGELSIRLRVEPERVERLLLSAGLPPMGIDEPHFCEGDVESLAGFLRGERIFGATAVRGFTRILGSSLARIAEAAVSLYLSTVEGPLREAHSDELAIARANLRATDALEIIPVAMRGLFRLHLITAIRRLRQARKHTRIETAHLAVGFVDLVGFTPLSRRLDAPELGALVDRFEDAAHEIATARDGRVVKMIGDEVMFVAVNATAACHIAVALVDRFADDPSVLPRGGLALGEVLIRGGDYYGPTVNLAARLAELAVPRELLVTPELMRDSHEPAVRFEPAGKRLLKGFDQPVTLFAIERDAGAHGAAGVSTTVTR